MKRPEREGVLADQLEAGSPTAVTGRRAVVRLFAGLTLLPFAGCSRSNAGVTGAGTLTSGTATSGGPTTKSQRSCSEIPEETTGPFPANGSDGINALELDGIVRTDIRSSIGPGRAVAEGVGLTLTFELLDTSASCAPLPGYVVYVWHSDRDGHYSMYSPPIERESYLRGVQAADANGRVTFTTIFPAAYSQRWPHVHFEIYPSLEEATSFRNKLTTSQLALPKDVCEAVYATPGYEASRRNLSEISIEADPVFNDGVALQLPTITGNMTDGYVATLVVGIAR